jgi:hypothetical protein
MNRHPKSERIEKCAKYYRRLHKELRQLSREKYNAPLVEPHEPPAQRKKFSHCRKTVIQARLSSLLWFPKPSHSPHPPTWITDV